jgi:uncharacterized protein YcaQ
VDTLDTLTTAEARRIALAAQGFADPRPKGRPDARSLTRVLGRIGLIQIDSVNVLTRAHYLPLWSRLGPYPLSLIANAAGKKPRRLFEYWAHEASYVPVETQPYLRFRMARAAQEAWGSMRKLAERDPGFVEKILDEVAEKGPLTAREVEHDAPRRKDHWGWNWSDVKVALEWLFFTGAITSAGRNSAFERRYDLPERVLPAHIVAAPTPTVEESHRELVRIAAKAHGVSTQQCLRDYFRLSVAETAQAVGELVEEGDLVPVKVDGWKRPAFLHKDAKSPRQVNARALIGPFDPLVFERTRGEKLFDFRYRLEIYVPKPKRIHGYYVLPFLLGDRLVARVDLKADRLGGVLQVQSAFAEEYAPPETAAELAAELTAMAGWLGVDKVKVNGRGDLAKPLKKALASR